MKGLVIGGLIIIIGAIIVLWACMKVSAMITEEEDEDE